MRCSRLLRVSVLPVVLALFAAACSSGGGDDTSAQRTTTTTTKPPETLQILLTNDDGVPGPGLDAAAQGLSKMPNVKVTVVAPATNQTGAGDSTTPGDLVVTEAPLPSGHPATAVAGKPADSVNYAFDKLGLTPDLVVSGVNPGSNFGPFTAGSGTVGAAKVAARRGVPALAVNSGTQQTYDFPYVVDLAVKWIEDHRQALLDGTAPVEVANLISPYCATGAVRGLLQVPMATGLDGRDYSFTDCNSTKPPSAIVDDLDASMNGFASLSIVPF